MDQFLLEMMMSDIERGLYQALLENPYDQATRNAYVDFLKENNRHASAERIKNGYTFHRGHLGTNFTSPADCSANSGLWFPPGEFASGSLFIPSPISITSGAVRREIRSTGGAW